MTPDGSLGPVARLRLLAALVCLTATFTSCRSGSVHIAYRPAPGTVQRYTVHVRSRAVTRIEGQAPDRTEQSSTLEVTHRVLDRRGGTFDVQIKVRDSAGAVRTFVVRLDRAAQLTEVRRVEGLPASIFEDAGLTELFPAAAGAPPSRALSPGERWVIDEPVDLPGLQASRLRGTGRLTVLGESSGRPLATVESRYVLPVRGATSGPDQRLLLDGDQTTFTRSVRDLGDGSVRRATARTSGHFRVTILPPPGAANSASVQGTLDVEVVSVTTAR
jgi:hypothetical protein